MLPEPVYEDAGLRLFHGSNLEVLRSDVLGYPHEFGYHSDRLIPDGTYDSICTDPPYELGFMGKGWDSSGIAYDVDVWRECFRVLKPGGYLLSFGGTRTWHRIATAIEDAGFEIRDSIAWMYGSGFPKSMDVSKAIDRAAGATREVVGVNPRAAQQTAKHDDTSLGKFAGTSPYLTASATDEAREWEGWGTALKPAFEPVVVARKPLGEKTVAANVLAYGTGAINIDASRVEFTSESDKASAKPQGRATARNGALAGKAQAWESATTSATEPSTTAGMTDSSAIPSKESAPSATGMERTEFTPSQSERGRFPSNVLLDESQAAELDRQAPSTGGSGKASGPSLREPTTAGVAFGARNGLDGEPAFYGGEKGGASRFFPTFRYEAKAPGSERPTVDGVAHATVKPLDLMRWLVRLVTRPGGRVLDLYAGSGTTGEAALLEGMEVDLIELEADHLPLIMQRIKKPLQPSMFGDWEEEAS